jgi:polyisoprenoid-binding protein YceI
MSKISSRIKFNKIELRKNKYGEKLKEPKLVDYKKWKNPYFTDNKIKKNKEISI